MASSGSYAAIHGEDIEEGDSVGEALHSLFATYPIPKVEHDSQLAGLHHQ
jgi:hypothetical protein